MWFRRHLCLERSELCSSYFLFVFALAYLLPYSGLVVQPQFMIGTFYVVPYYITPGSYVYNGLITALYVDNNSTVVGEPGSGYSEYLAAEGRCYDDSNGLCVGTAQQYVLYFFGGQFGVHGLNMRNALVLGLFLVVSRLFTWIALKYIRFSN